jgi:hypothetical protein
MVPVSLGFHARKNFPECYPKLGHDRPKFSPAFLNTENLKNIGFEGRQIISLPGGTK